MKIVIYARSSGKIFSIQETVSKINITTDMAKGMFPDIPDIAVWTTSKPISLDDTLKHTDIGVKILSPDGEEKEQKILSGSKNIMYTGSFYDAGGYAGMNREILFRLNSMGFNVKSNPLGTPIQIDPITVSKIDFYKNIEFDDDGIHIIGFTPMAVGEGAYRIGYTMMETASLHHEFINRCNKYYDEIWTPSEWNANLFQNNGIKKPIHVMPLGVNLSLYNDKAQPATIRSELLPQHKMTTEFKSFVFMSLFGWSYRKGYDVLLKAFTEEFSAEEDVSLLVCARYQGGSDERSKKHIRHEINMIHADSSRKMKRPSAPIHFFGDIIPIDDMPRVYSIADCFVHMSRGEGWNLPLMEAAVMGMPIISTYNSAMTDYLNEDNAYLVHTDELKKSDRRMNWITEYYRNQYFPHLGIKSINECRRLMRHVYRNKQEAVKKAEKLKNTIYEKYTWDLCAQRVSRRLSEIISI